jgi:ABC-type transport system substrate-binding protein
MTTLTTAEFVQSQLAEVGIDVSITQHADTASYGEQRAAGDFDLNIEVPNQNDANPAFLIALRWFSEATGDNVQYVMPGPDTRFDELVAQTMVELDPDELTRLAAEAMHELVDVEVATVPLAAAFRIYVMHEDIAGFDPHPSGTNQLWRSVYWSTGSG